MTTTPGDGNDEVSEPYTVPVTLSTSEVALQGVIPGPKGERGQRGKDTFRQFAVIGVFIVLTALVLGYLVQQGRDYTAEQCILRRDAVIHQNTTWDQLTAIEEIPVKTTSAASAMRIKARIKVYADAKVAVPDCDKA